jgi:broad specificity phosphatase PhoE
VDEPPPPALSSVRRLFLVRHGESTWNADGRWQGQADPPLTDLGERQARSAAAAVAALAPAIVVASDLERARSTAALLAPGVVLEVEPAFRERDAGEWTGLTRDEIEERYPGDLAAWRSPPSFEGDEPLLARVMPAVARWAARVPAGGCGIVVTHGGVIRTVERVHGAPSVAVPNLGGRWLHLDADAVVTLGDRDVLIDPDDDVALTVPHQI